MACIEIAINMIRRTIGSKRGFLSILLVPALVISLFIGLQGSGPDKVDIEYMNKDVGILGEYLVQELQTNPDFVLKKVNDERDLKDHVIKQETQAAFVIPVDFTERLMAEKEANVAQFGLGLNEASFVTRMELEQQIDIVHQMIQWLDDSGMNASERQETLKKLLAQQEKHQVQVVATDDHFLVSASLSTVIGFMLMFIMTLANSSVGAILEDRRARTMARIYAAPVRSFEIMLGNFCGCMVLGTIQIIFILLITRGLLGFEYGIGFLQQWVVLECFLLASLGIASAAAGMARNANNLNNVYSLILIPTCMIGGCFWPLEIMPEFMQKIANFVPQKWAIEAIVNLAGGETFAEVGLPLAILGLFAIILLGLGSAVLKPSETEVA